MTIRQVLQIEIWSKQTTRKIWIGFAAVALVFFTFYLVTTLWISPLERRTGKEALASIEVFQAGSNTQLDTLRKQAEEKVETAHQECFTARDQQISFWLEFYLAGVVLDKAQQRERDLSDIRLRKLALPKNPKVDQLLAQAHDRLGRNLHQALD